MLRKFNPIDYPGQIGCGEESCTDCHESFGVDPCKEELFAAEGSSQLLNFQQLPPGAIIVRVSAT